VRRIIADRSRGEWAGVAQPLETNAQPANSTNSTISFMAWPSWWE
jgi:hypothetical protein